MIIVINRLPYSKNLVVETWVILAIYSQSANKFILADSLHVQSSQLPIFSTKMILDNNPPEFSTIRFSAIQYY